MTMVARLNPQEESVPLIARVPRPLVETVVRHQKKMKLASKSEAVRDLLERGVREANSKTSLAEIGHHQTREA